MSNRSNCLCRANRSLFVFVVPLVVACGSSNAPSNASGGGTVGVGGASSTGGADSGGASATTETGGSQAGGGNAATGGNNAATGGNNAATGGTTRKNTISAMHWV